MESLYFEITVEIPFDCLLFIENMENRNLGIPSAIRRPFVIAGCLASLHDLATLHSVERTILSDKDGEIGYYSFELLKKASLRVPLGAHISFGMGYSTLQVLNEIGTMGCIDDYRDIVRMAFMLGDQLETDLLQGARLFKGMRSIPVYREEDFYQPEFFHVCRHINFQ